MRTFRVTGIIAFLACTVAAKAAAAQDAGQCLYNDAHFHVQDFRAQGLPIPDVVKMMDGNVCRAVLMGLAVTIAHDPLVDGSFAPVYYTQTDGQALYYNAIQDVLVAHKFMALPEKDRARFDPLMSAFNLKDSRSAEYIQMMVRLYPGVWSGFGEIHFKKVEFSEKVAGGPPSLYSSSLDTVFDAIGEMRAAAVVHCDHDTPGSLDLRKDAFARAYFEGKPKPQYLEAFQAFLKRHPNVTFVWAHFMGNGRGVRPYPEHWQFLDEMLGDPAYAARLDRHVVGVRDRRRHSRHARAREDDRGPDPQVSRPLPLRVRPGRDLGLGAPAEELRRLGSALAGARPRADTESREGELRARLRPVEEEHARLGGEERRARPVVSQSSRSAVTGSSVAARWAGSRLAAPATAARPAAARTIVAGSLGPRP